MNTQTIAQILLGLNWHSGFGFHMHSAAHYIDSLTPSSALTHTDPRQLPAKLCEFCVYFVCVDALPGETNRAWQAKGKQSADVCVGIVSATTLRRHFSLIQGGFSSFHIKYLQREGHRSGLDEIGKEDKDYCMDRNTTFFEKPAEEMRRLSLPFPIGYAAARRPLLCVVCLQDPPASSSLRGLGRGEPSVP